MYALSLVEVEVALSITSEEAEDAIIAGRLPP